MKTTIEPQILKAVSKAVQMTGSGCYIVGGFVRNFILGGKSDDIDFVVEGDSLIFAERTAEILGRKKVVKFPRFKTAKIIYRKTNIEFVSARKETYSYNSRKPSVQSSSLFDDLSRRDFTINALACPVENEQIGEIIDYFGGLEDIKSGVLRTPLAPDVTYSDDPLRMLRGIRFASVLGFRIDRCSFDAISRNVQRISIVSVERISDEFFKMLGSKSPVKAVYLMYRSGLLGKLFPELTELCGIEVREGVRHKDGFIHTLKVLSNISKYTEKKELRLAALMHDIGKPETKYFRQDAGWTFHGHDEKGAGLFKNIALRFRWSNEVAEYVSKIIRLHHRPISLAQEEVTDSGVRRLLFEGGEDVEDLMLLCRADITTANRNKLNRYLENFDRLSVKLKEVEEKDRLRNFKPPISGEDIMAELKEGAGPRIGRIKSMIVEAVLNGDIDNERNAALELMRRLINEERAVK